MLGIDGTVGFHPVLNPNSLSQIVGSQSAPETEQHHSPVSWEPRKFNAIAALNALGNGSVEPGVHLLQCIDLEWTRLFGRLRVGGANAFQYLTHDRGLGGIGKSVIRMPARQRG